MKKGECWQECSIVCFCMPLCMDIIKIEKEHKAKLISQQRKGLLRGCLWIPNCFSGGYSGDSWFPPLDLMVAEICFCTQLEVNSQVIEEWRETERWISGKRDGKEETGTANWTKKIIKDIKLWVECRHRRTGYFLPSSSVNHGVTYKANGKKIVQNMQCGSVRWKKEREKIIQDLVIPATCGDSVIECDDAKNGTMGYPCYEGIAGDPEWPRSRGGLG
ncbi:hypothetical protein WA026_005364 [Henosepilachna vigintioctopunctata]|uniref:Uncharacterized protein n=1 Tax=Henosepilachna vigintioctopunctata TaxID=420089 RepID=A0AAW1U2X9_9CUCU